MEWSCHIGDMTNLTKKKITTNQVHATIVDHRCPTGTRFITGVTMYSFHAMPESVVIYHNEGASSVQSSLIKKCEDCEACEDRFKCWTK